MTLIFVYIIIGYFLIQNIIFFILFLVSYFGIRNYKKDLKLNNFMTVYNSKLTSPLSFLISIYNEENSIVKNIKRFLEKFNYPEYELIIINDGSTDGTLQTIVDELKCEVYNIPFKKSLETKNIKGIYKSKLDERIVVIDKECGGKADALNAGINIARYPYFGSIDSETILENDSYFKVMFPVLNSEEEVVAMGGIVGILNGCQAEENISKKVKFRGKILVKFQVVEYLREFLLGRYAWTRINGLPIISGAFGLFQKNAVIECGGYCAGLSHQSTAGEDMELVIRLHKYFNKNKRKYKIIFVPDLLSWTKVPEKFTSLMKQRIRWHHGLMNTVKKNMELLFNYKYGSIGMLSIPFYLLFAFLSPFIELAAYVGIPYLYFTGNLSAELFTIFIIVSILLGAVISTCSVFLETITFNRYRGMWTLTKLYLYAVLENFGYKQMTILFRVFGFFRFFVK